MSLRTKHSPRHLAPKTPEHQDLYVKQLSYTGSGRIAVRGFVDALAIEDTFVPSAPDTDLLLRTVTQLELSPSLHERTKRLASMEGKDLVHMAKSIHAVVAPDANHDMQSKAAKIQAKAGFHRPVRLMKPTERPAFFDRSCELIRTLGIHTTQQDEPAFVARTANVVALTIALAHPFEDGNGRTARTLAHAILHGAPATELAMQPLAAMATKRSDHGVVVDSYAPRADRVQAMPFIEAVAALDIPIQNTAAYTAHIEQLFHVPSFRA